MRNSELGSTKSDHLISSELRTPNSELRTPNWECGMGNSEVRIGSFLPTSDFRLPTSDFRTPNSELRLPTSELRLPTSEFPRPHRTSVTSPESRSLRPSAGGQYGMGKGKLFPDPSTATPAGYQRGDPMGPGRRYPCSSEERTVQCIRAIDLGTGMIPWGQAGFPEKREYSLQGE